MIVVSDIALLPCILFVYNMSNQKVEVHRALLIFETFVEDYSEAKKRHTYNIAPKFVVLFFGAEVSGRDKAFLESYFGAYASFTLIAEHGLPSMSWGWYQSTHYT